MRLVDILDKEMCIVDGAAWNDEINEACGISFAAARAALRGPLRHQRHHRFVCSRLKNLWPPPWQAIGKGSTLCATGAALAPSGARRPATSDNAAAHCRGCRRFLLVSIRLGAEISGKAARSTRRQNERLAGVMLGVARRGCDTASISRHVRRCIMYGGRALHGKSIGGGNGVDGEAGNARCFVEYKRKLKSCCFLK